MSGPFDRVWTQQPPSAVRTTERNVSVLWNPALGLNNLVNGAGASTIGSGMVRGAGAGGVSYSAASSLSSISFPISSLSTAGTPFSILHVFQWDGITNRASLAVGNAGFLTLTFGGGNIIVQIASNTVNALTLSLASVPPRPDGAYAVAISYDGAALTAAVNGVSMGSYSTSNLGSANSVTVNPSDGVWQYADQGPRFLTMFSTAPRSAAWVLQKSTNPWSIFGKRSNPIFVGLQAASTVVTTTGDSSVTLPFTGTSVAVAPIVGTSTGTLSLTPVSAAVVKVFGAGASQTIALTGTSVATDPVAGASSGTVSLTGTSAGTLAVAGASAATISVSPASSGGVAVDGDAVGTVSLAATSAATVSISGASASQSVLVTGTSAAAARVAGASSQSVSVSGTSAGAVAISGASANQTITLTGTATASTSGAGYSAAEIGLTGTATAITSIVGASTATFDVSEAAVGSVAVDGDAVGTIVLAADSTATVGVSGASVGASFEVTGVSTGLAEIAGSSAQQIDLSGSGYATFLQRVTSTASFDILAVSAGIIEQPSGGGGVVDPAAVWNYSLSNGKTAGDTLVEMHAMLRDLYRIHGLEITMPLSVTPTERTAGPIVQAVTEAVGAVTVARQ